MDKKEFEKFEDLFCERLARILVEVILKGQKNENENIINSPNNKSEGQVTNTH